jgi:hypothetical protein
MQGAAKGASHALVRRRGSIAMEERPYVRRPHARHQRCRCRVRCTAAWAARAMLGRQPATERCERQERSVDLQERVGAPDQRPGAAAVCPGLHSTPPRHLARARQAAAHECADARHWRRKCRAAVASLVASCAAVPVRHACRTHGAALLQRRRYARCLAASCRGVCATLLCCPSLPLPAYAFAAALPPCAYSSRPRMSALPSARRAAAQQHAAARRWAAC